MTRSTTISISPRMFVKFIYLFIFFFLTVYLNAHSTHSNEEVDTHHQRDELSEAGGGDHATMNEEGNEHAAMNSAQSLVQKEVDTVRIDEKVGDILDTNLVFFDQLGNEVLLSDFVGEKPLVLSFAYYSCETLCQFVLLGQTDVFNKMGLEIGEDYRALTVSFDIRDDVSLTKTMIEVYRDKVNRESDKSDNVDWTFLYGKEREVRSITEQLGFYYNFIPATGEFAHSTAIYVISPKGKISRYFYGIEFNPFDLKLALIEAKDEKSRTTVERVLLFCYSYDSESRGYALVARNIMKAGGGLIILLMGGFFIMMKRKKS